MKPAARESAAMALEREFDCPRCEESQSFWKTASMEVHIGVKTKWRCTECDYGLVRIDGEVDSSLADA